jgi:transcriptional regulator with XRE-family HTH domain
MSVDKNEVRSLLQQGMTYEQVGTRFGVTRQYIHQIAKREGFDSIPVERRRAERASRDQEAEAWSVARWSVDRATHRMLKANGAKKAYMEQRNNAASRGIGWDISLAEWWAIWCESDKWPLRGRERGCYSMGRIRDAGPYTPGNVAIVPVSENSRYSADGTAKARDRGDEYLGFRPDNAGKPWVVRVGRRHMGCFASKEDAIRARDIALSEQVW